MRWLGTGLYLIGMVLTALNIFPLNLLFGMLGGAAWCLVGIKWQDRALILVEAASAGIYAFGIAHWAMSRGLG